MDLENSMRWLKIGLLFTVLLISIVVSYLMLQVSMMSSNFFAYLGILPGGGDGCSGSLTLTTSGSGKCVVEAKIMTDGCRGRKYQVRENSCSGYSLCENTVNYDSFQGTCAWNVGSGNYKYVLCINNWQKDSAYITCR